MRTFRRPQRGVWCCSVPSWVRLLEYMPNAEVGFYLSLRRTIPASYCQTVVYSERPAGRQGSYTVRSKG